MNTIFKPEVLNVPKKFKVIPSEKIYWNKYAYKILLKIPVEVDEPADGTKAQIYKNSVSPWVYDRYRKAIDVGARVVHCIGGRYSRQTWKMHTGSKNHFCLFLKHHGDALALLNEFDEEVIEIHGPVSEDHLDILYSIEKVALRNKKWFGKYDTKLEVANAFGFRQNLNEKRENIESIKQFFKDNLTELRITRGFYYINMYTTAKQLDDIYAFYKLTYPNVRTTRTKCILINTLKENTHGKDSQ